MPLDETRASDESQLGRVPPEAIPGTKTIARTLLVSAANGPLAGETINYGFDLVNFDYRTWHEYEWGNWVAVDALLNAAFRGVADVQIWVPSHGYIVDDVVVSTETGLAYKCLVAHTSNATSIMPDLASGKWVETIIGDSYTKGEADVLFVNVAGDVMTGPLTLYGDPSQPQHAADKQYVDLLDANQKTYIDAQDAAVTASINANKVSKTGDTMTGPLVVPLGSSAAPSLTFAGYTGHGIFASSSNLYFSVSGTYKMGVSATSLSIGTGVKLISAASSVSRAGFQMLPGVAPTAPVDGDTWATTAGIFTRTGGATVGPLTDQAYVDAKDTTQKAYIDAADAALQTAINGRMRWAGAWVAGTYNANDVVTDTGYLFVAKQTTTQKPYTGKPPAPTQWDILAGGGGGSSVVVSATPPVGPIQGDMWFSTVEPVGLFVWYDDGSGAQWVQTNGGAGTACLPLTGGTLSGTLLIENAGPVLRFHETDAVSPAGQFGFSATNSGDFSFVRYSADAFTSPVVLWNYTADAFNFFTGAVQRLQISSTGTVISYSGGPIASFLNASANVVVPFRGTGGTGTGVYIGAGPTGSQISTPIVSAETGNALTLRSGIDTSPVISFRNAANSTIGYMDVGGTASGGTNTIITREKGDLRYAAASSRRYKEEIVSRDVVDLVSAFDALNVSQWTWGGEIPDQDERHGTPGVGLIAEEVVDVFPEAVTYQWMPTVEEDGVPLPETEKRINGLDPLALIAMLIAKIRAQDERIAALEAV